MLCECERGRELGREDGAENEAISIKAASDAESSGVAGREGDNAAGVKLVVGQAMPSPGDDSGVERSTKTLGVKGLRCSMLLAPALLLLPDDQRDASSAEAASRAELLRRQARTICCSCWEATNALELPSLVAVVVLAEMSPA